MYLATQQRGGEPRLCESGTVVGRTELDAYSDTVWIQILRDGNTDRIQAEWVRRGQVIDVMPMKQADEQSTDMVSETQLGA
jgi:hypothetical protein